MQAIYDKLPGPGKAAAKGRRNQFKPNPYQRELLEEYKELQRKLREHLDSEASSYKSIRQELYKAWVNTLNDSETRRASRGGLKQPAEFKVPLSEDEQKRKEQVDFLLITLLSIATDGLASYSGVTTTLLGRTVSGGRAIGSKFSKLLKTYDPKTKIGNLLRKYLKKVRVKPGVKIDDSLKSIYIEIANSPKMGKAIERYNKIAEFFGQKRSVSVDEIVQALENDTTFAGVWHHRSAVFVGDEHQALTKFFLQGSPGSAIGRRYGRHELLHLGAALNGQRNRVAHEFLVNVFTTPEQAIAIGAGTGYIVVKGTQTLYVLYTDGPEIIYFLWNDE